MAVLPRCLLLLALLTAIDARAGLAPASDAGHRSAIRELACRWIDRYTAGDLDGLMSLYDPEVRVMLHGRPAMSGRERIREFFAAGIDGPSPGFRLIIDEIVVHGDTAHLISRYWLWRTDTDGEVVYQDSGRSLLIYRRRAEAGWLITVDIDQATPDASWADRPPPGADSCGGAAAG